MTPIGYNPNHPYAEPNVTSMYNSNDSYFAHPYGTRNNGHQMIGTKVKQAANKLGKKGNKKHKLNRAKQERKRLKAKADSPGVPPNTCPYIDLVQTMIADLQGAYERLRTRGDHNPVVDNISTQASDLLEYVRTNNETLRDNSAYWYEKYKQQLK